MRKYAVEFIGTFFLILTTDGVIGPVFYTSVKDGK